MKIIRNLLVIYVGIFFTTVSAESVIEKKVLTFGVVPQQSAGQLARNWGPILRYIEQNSGIKMRFATAPSIPEFERRLAAGEYDVSYMNPYHYTVFHESPGYQAFAKAKGKRIKGIVVIRKDSPVTNMEQLDGSLMAFPAPAAFAASVLPRAYLNRKNIDVEAKYVSSHDSVYLSVARGLYPAGGGVVRTFNLINPTVRDQLKVLWTSEPFTSHALAAHSRVPQDVVEKILQALVSLEKSPEGIDHLKALSWKGVEAANDDQWNDVRDLGLDLLINGT